MITPAASPPSAAVPRTAPTPASSPTSHHAAPPQPVTVARAAATAPARCSELLQKASLEALSADETAFLKRECR